MRQTQFRFMRDFKKSFGGSLLQGKRKTIRALSTTHPIHLVLKTSGHRGFNPGNRSIEKLIHALASKYSIKIHRLSLNWTHSHMIIVIPSRDAYKSFIRTCTSTLVRAFSQTTRKPLKGIFELRPFTRILEWGRDYRNVMDYHDLNDLEARGYNRRPQKIRTQQTEKPRQ